MLNACLHGHRQEHAVALTLACFLGNKAVSPDKSEQQSKELLEAKGEVLRLRAQVRRVEAGRLST